MPTVLEQIEALPLRPAYQKIPPRGKERYITLHYSAVVYNDQTPVMERARIISEAKYQINKNWAPANKTPIYGDGLMYDYVVLKSGEVVPTRRNRQQLWHCGNALGNSCSWSVHVMYGGTQTLTPAQRASMFALFDQLRSQSDIPRENVVGHCEWPRYNGVPVLSSSYTVLPGQSECPGRYIIQDIYAYRAMSDVAAVDTPVFDKEVVSNAAYAAVYTDRSYTSPRAKIEDNEVNLWPGNVIELDDVTNGWGHLSSHLGFVNMAFLKDVGSPDPEVAPAVPVIEIDRTYSESSLIVVDYQSSASVEGIVNHLASLPGQPYSRFDLETIVLLYKQYGEQSGVDWVAALAQNMHETDSFRSWWAQRPRRNPAGLRVTGEKRKSPPANDLQWAYNERTGLWHRGMSFSSWDESTKAHMAYLLSYARTNEQLTQTQYDFIASSTVAFVLTRTTNRGVAPTLIGLNGRWAVPGTTYATRIAAIANKLMEKK